MRNESTKRAANLPDFPDAINFIMTASIPGEVADCLLKVIEACNNECSRLEIENKKLNRLILHREILENFIEWSGGFFPEDCTTKQVTRFARYADHSGKSIEQIIEALKL